MSSIYYPARGFFIGKARRYLNVLVVVSLLVAPTIIQADTMPAAQATASATTPVATLTTTTPASTSALDTSIPLKSLTNWTQTELAWVTAYTSDPDQTSAHPLITASGNMVHDGVVADNLLPFGTQIEIPALFGSKVFTVEDRTNAKYTGRVDIWMPNDAQALNFGIQHVQIVVLSPNLAMQ